MLAYKHSCLQNDLGVLEAQFALCAVTRRANKT